MSISGSMRVAGAALLLAASSMGLMLPQRAHAQLTVQERAPLVQPRAERARAALRAQGNGLYRVEADFAEALGRAERHWRDGQADEAVLALAALQKYGPLAELPFIKAHLLLAAIADARHDRELRNHHQAFAVALVADISASGDGARAASALRLVLASEAEGWLLAQDGRLRPLGKRSVTTPRASFDVWRVRDTAGAEREVWFDLSVLLKTARAPKKSS